MRRITTGCLFALVLSACGGSSPAAPAPPPAPATPRTAVNQGSISAGEVGRCGPFASPCLAYGPYVARAGTFTAQVVWTDSDTFLFLELVDAQRRQVVLSSLDASSTLARRSHSLSTNVTDGTYYLHVWYVLGSHITPFELTATWMA